MLLKALWLVVRRSLQQHKLAGSITAFSIALACALILTITSLQLQAVRVFTGQTGGFDAVLGARGSALQLVLCTLYHLENSPGNLAFEQYLAVKKDPLVARAVPIALGDNYLGYRLVGTLPDFFSAWGRNGLRFQTGAAFTGAGQAVVGSWVAQKTGLKLGDHFHPYHGLNYDPSAEHDEDYEVVGVLQPTNTPQDRVVLIPLEGVYRMSGHVLRGRGHDFTPQPGQAIPEADQELSGVLLKLKSAQAGMLLDERINRQGKTATLAWPVARLVYELFSKLGWAIQLMQVLTVLVLVVAAASITASLCNSLQERRREFAILRALGARRWFVAGVVTLESLWLCLLGTVWGIGLHLALMAAVGAWLRSHTGVQFEILVLHPLLLAIPLATSALGLLAGLLPSWLVYRSNVNLHL
ncbi:MAG: ABC transporter permease [Candidatus Eremiobacteraeota bacterium]|nr:ABC transporter permease [Candidatus Eremiobacteraeota bacterium]